MLTIEPPTKEEIKSELFRQYGKLIREAILNQQIQIIDLNNFEYAAFEFYKYRQKNWDQIQVEKIKELRNTLPSPIMNLKQLGNKEFNIEK